MNLSREMDCIGVAVHASPFGRGRLTQDLSLVINTDWRDWAHPPECGYDKHTHNAIQNSFTYPVTFLVTSAG